MYVHTCIYSISQHMTYDSDLVGSSSASLARVRPRSQVLLLPGVEAASQKGSAQGFRSFKA